MHRSVGCCEALCTIQVLIRANSDRLSELTSSQSIKLLIRLVRMLNNAKELQHNSPQYDSCSTKDIQLAAANCLETCCSRFATIEPFTLGNILTSTLELLFVMQPDEYDAHIFCHLSTALLTICKHVVLSNRGLATRHVGDLLGAARSFMMYGLPNVAWTRPVRVIVSQQAVAEPADKQRPNQGGKVAKTRKIRADRARSLRSSSEVPNNDRGFGPERLEFATVSTKSFGQMTSESEFSESESNRDRKDRHREAQLRFAALSLIGLVGQVSWYLKHPISTQLIAIFYISDTGHSNTFRVLALAVPRRRSHCQSYGRRSTERRHTRSQSAVSHRRTAGGHSHSRRLQIVSHARRK